MGSSRSGTAFHEDTLIVSCLTLTSGLSLHNMNCEASRGQDALVQASQQPARSSNGIQFPYKSTFPYNQTKM